MSCNIGKQTRGSGGMLSHNLRLLLVASNTIHIVSLVHYASVHKCKRRHMVVCSCVGLCVWIAARYVQFKR